MKDFDASMFLEPESTCTGDPYIAEILKFDEVIVDHTYYVGWRDVADGSTDAMVAWGEVTRFIYELKTLYRWWSL